MICEARIKNGYLDVCVSSLGAEIQSIKKQGVEYLWQGNPDIWERRAPVLGLWSPPGKNIPFICIEPWYGCNDRVDFAGELKDRPWIQKLEPGQIFTMTCTFSFP